MPRSGWLFAPLALKGLGFAHKTEAGAVRLGLATLVGQAEMAGATGYLAEEMVTGVVAEALLGLRRDPVYGVTLTLGMGGVTAEVLADTVTLVWPLDAAAIHAGLRQLRLWPLLDGYRGRARADVAALVDMALRLGRLMAEDASLEEIEINPVMLRAEGPHRLALAGGGLLDLDVITAEPELFAGLRCTLGFRLEESAAQLAEGLRHHARHHGLQAALVVNRLPDPAPEAFAADLRAALGDTALRVVLLQADVALGKPGLGPENHLYLAPDAPGKDRMTPPAPDAWRSPLGESIVLEAMKWRFLSGARSVLLLDASDLLAPCLPGAPTAFEACEAAAQGVILLVGQRIYPWRVRAGREPRGAAGNPVRQPGTAGAGRVRRCLPRPGTGRHGGRRGGLVQPVQEWLPELPRHGAGEDGAAVNVNGRHIGPQNAHHAAGHVFVATADHQHAVHPLAANTGFYAIGNHFTADQ